MQSVILELHQCKKANRRRSVDPYSIVSAAKVLPGDVVMFPSLSRNPNADPNGLWHTLTDSIKPCDCEDGNFSGELCFHGEIYSLAFSWSFETFPQILKRASRLQDQPSFPVTYLAFKMKAVRLGLSQDYQDFLFNLHFQPKPTSGVELLAA